MESLLRGIASDSAKQTEAAKKQLFAMLFQTISKSPMTHVECTSLLKLLQEWILTSDNQLLVQTGLEQFSVVSRGNISIFYDFVTPNKIIDIFTNPQHNSTSRIETVKLVGIILDLLNNNDGGECFEGSRGELDELRRTVANVARPHLFTYLRDHGVLLPVAVEISRVYQRQPSVLPNEADYTRFATLVVNLLAGYRKPLSSSSDDVNNGSSSSKVSSSSFSADAEEVSMMLPMVWGRSEATEGIEECLKAFYVIISTEEDSFSKPSCALLTIVDKVTQPFLLKATQAILEESGQQQGEAKTVVALHTMIEWLTQERSNQATSEWILNMLQKLKEKGRNSILIDIAHQSTDKLMSALLKPDLRPFVEQIFFFLLLGFQHTETAFHSVVVQLPKALAELGRRAKFELVATSNLLNRLAEAAHFLMVRFPGFPELYNPVHEVLEQLAIGPPDEARFGELKSLSWTSPLLTAGLQQINSPRKKRLSSLSSLGGGLNASAAIDDQPLELRSETGMVGLINLGNTCYMNSVLQALFITKNFCNDVLVAPITSHQTVLFRLQIAFSFLRDSQRSIYSPAEFLKAARPPWFEAGRQQDCSEFLRYLLDTLHEQEKSGHGRGGAVTYGEHRIIKNESPSKEDQQQVDSNGSHQSNDGSVASAPASPSAAATTTTEDEPAKLKRASNSALDVISEVPEIRKEEDENDEDDRMSQGSGARIDDDYFGSHSSVNLAKDHMDQDDDEGEAEEDMGGSRASLGSAGLKRWTTEGNLSSYDGSREGKMDLLDGPPIHDSHSNSTDSGIQSVGDSIRGSSDSVTNNATTAAATTAATAGSSSNNQNNNNTFTSLVQTIFGGKMQTSYKCATCNLESQHKECFTDINLAMPADTKSPSPPTSSLTMQSLLLKYLEPEKLEEDNKYQCDRCQSLQEAVKSVSILEGPQHLMCTLMRFKYDRAAGRKSKIFTEVDYELSIELPTSAGGVSYSLYAAVVHSGYSSDGGHYYTYGREDLDNDDDWLVFNDSKVSHCSFEEFKSLPKRFSRDTAYVLFYRRKEEEEEVRRVPLRPELRQTVERDNLQFLREKERSSYSGGGNSGNSNGNGSDKWRKRGDDGSAGGGGGSGCGGGGFNTMGRMVC